MEECLQQKLSQTYLAESIIKEMKESNKSKVTRVEQQLKYMETLEAQIILFNTQKEEFILQLQPLTVKNEEIKLKFSQLLDQFQEYVIQTEKKMEEEQEA